ncbi:regulatory protein GemA [Paragemmobacter straminiformis]|uniref:Regulatory protein GemA n=1 Tax=Paragemmobacter straminiformis TaxID=2045119 RepID=A0A842I4V6_9RHOB|nr:regulatory protein GemA [Gemmobacter straminiformis]MBC2834686.1 regulatory protein GemA [Gemmobacter straminiformis]
MSASVIRKIHVGCRQLGIDEETRRDLTLQVVGKDSLRACSTTELEAVVDALKARGFKPEAKGTKARAPRPFASRSDVRFCHVLWSKLVHAGAVAVPGAEGLNAFVRARFEKSWGAVPIDVDQMRDWKQIASVIEALKGMCARAGIKVEAR